MHDRTSQYNRVEELRPEVCTDCRNFRCRRARGILEGSNVVGGLKYAYVWPLQFDCSLVGPRRAQLEGESDVTQTLGHMSWGMQAFKVSLQGASLGHLVSSALQGALGRKSSLYP